MGFFTNGRRVMLANPLLDEYVQRRQHVIDAHPEKGDLYNHQPGYNGCWQCRDYEPDRFHLRKKFAWAVPDEEALDLVARYSPEGVVEIGAGLGYWAHQLVGRGVDVVAYDVAPHGNHWCEGEPWFPVRIGGPEVAGLWPLRTLLLCWPCYGDPMAVDAVRFYQGDTIVYIGEEDGATGDEDFRHLLASEWEEVEEYSHPQWWGLWDRTFVYKRLALRRRTEQ